MDAVTGDDLLDAILDVADHAYRQGRAVEARDLACADEEHRATQLAIDRARKLAERLMAE